MAATTATTATSESAAAQGAVESPVVAEAALASPPAVGAAASRPYATALPPDVAVALPPDDGVRFVVGPHTEAILPRIVSMHLGATASLPTLPDNDGAVGAEACAPLLIATTEPLASAMPAAAPGPLAATPAPAEAASPELPQPLPGEVAAAGPPSQQPQPPVPASIPPLPDGATAESTTRTWLDGATAEAGSGTLAPATTTLPESCYPYLASTLATAASQGEASATASSAVTAANASQNAASAEPAPTVLHAEEAERYPFLAAVLQQEAALSAQRTEAATAAGTLQANLSTGDAQQPVDAGAALGPSSPLLSSPCGGTVATDPTTTDDVTPTKQHSFDSLRFAPRPAEHASVTTSRRAVRDAPPASTVSPQAVPSTPPLATQRVSSTSALALSPLALGASASSAAPRSHRLLAPALRAPSSASMIAIPRLSAAFVDAHDVLTPEIRPAPPPAPPPMPCAILAGPAATPLPAAATGSASTAAPARPPHPPSQGDTAADGCSQEMGSALPSAASFLASVFAPPSSPPAGPSSCAQTPAAAPSPSTPAARAMSDAGGRTPCIIGPSLAVGMATNNESTDSEAALDDDGAGLRSGGPDQEEVETSEGRLEQRKRKNVSTAVQLNEVRCAELSFVVNVSGTYLLRLVQVMRARSANASLVLLNMPPISGDVTGYEYLEYLSVLQEGLKRVLLVRGCGTEVVTIYS